MNFNELKEIFENYKYNFNLTLENDDGRLNSAINESKVIAEINTIFNSENIIYAKVREWYDIALQFENNFYPINIKISEGNSADNISSKKGLFYCLTGILPNDKRLSNINHWANYNKELNKFLDWNSKSDYYFLIIFKDTKQVLFTSLKHISELVPNGNNLPFQCKWKNNIKMTDRSEKEQILYIINTYIQSFKKKLAGLDELLQLEQSINGENNNVN